MESHMDTSSSPDKFLGTPNLGLRSMSQVRANGKAGMSAKTESKSEGRNGATNRSRNNVTSSNGRWQLTSVIHEGHNTRIYGVAFCVFLSPWSQSDSGRHYWVVATASEAQTKIYRVAVWSDAAPAARSDSHGIEALQTYENRDADEKFYCCCWAMDTNTRRLLLVSAGACGVLRIIDPVRQDFVMQLQGHTCPVLDVRACLSRPYLVASASDDYDIILWNLLCGVAVARFGGWKGHKTEVLSCDIDYAAERLLSASIDGHIRLWNLRAPQVQAKLELSMHWPPPSPDAPPRTFPTEMVHVSTLSNSQLHTYITDCVRFYGHLLLSKGCDNSIVLWKQGSDVDGDLNDRTLISKPDQQLTVLHKFQFVNEGIWFIRFDVDVGGRVLACGNERGQLCVWDLAGVRSAGSKEPASDDGDGRIARKGLAGVRPTVLTDKRASCEIRQVAVSPDARTILAVSSNSRLFRWDRLADS